MPRLNSILHIGIDEAGLGPTLGPLVTAGFAIIEPDDELDLRTRLQDAISQPGANARKAASPYAIEVGDSKAIHSGAHKLARLERTVLSTLAWIHGRLPKTTHELFEWAVETSEYEKEDRQAPWFGLEAEALPFANDSGDLKAAADNLCQVAEEQKLSVPTYRADVFSATRINRELNIENEKIGGSKNTWATAAVLRMADCMLQAINDNSSPRHVVLDKAGGRQSYSDAMRQQWGDEISIQVLEEDRPKSHYRLSPNDSGSNQRNPPNELSFIVKGDIQNPRIAWASCLAKYLREVHMRAFNRYWLNHDPNLRPTAGYPQDAKRFIADVRALAKKLKLSDDIWIRCK